MSNLKVIDFFCGAGGFSEGFRQMGYEIIYGFDYWKPAVDTFNHNFNLKCEPKNILEFKNSIEEIGVDPHHLSSHYLATRVWQPLLHNDQNHYMNHRNDAIGQAVSKILPRTEDFSPLQIHIWKREAS